MNNFLKTLITTTFLTTAYGAETTDNAGKQVAKYAHPSHEISLIITADHLKDALSKRFPSLFSGHQEMRSNPLIPLKRAFSNLLTDNPILMLPEARPALEWMRTQIQQMTQKHPQLGLLVAEIDHDLKMGSYDLSKLCGYGLRVLGAISGEPTHDALAVFRQFDGDTVDKKMRAGWQSPTAPSDAVEDIEFRNSPEYIKFQFSPEFAIPFHFKKMIGDLVLAINRPSLNIPIFGKGKLGLVTLIEGFMNRLYPMPISDKGLSAHGIPMTPLLFGLHDWLHGEADDVRKENIFSMATQQKLKPLLADKFDAEKLAELVTHHMVARTNLLEDTLTDLLNLYITHYMPEYGMHQLKRILVGFFNMVHEEANIMAEILTSNSLDKIVRILLPFEEFIDEPNLQTDPVTGMTKMSAEKALDAIFKAESTLEDGFPSKEQKNFPREYRLKKSHLVGAQYRVEMNQTPMITTVTLRIAGGERHTWEVETLKYYLERSLDDVGLLNIAGIKMTPPTEAELSGDNGRDIAIEYLGKVSQEIGICKSLVLDSALDLMGVKVPGTNESLWERYFRKSTQLDRQLKEAAAKVE